MSEQNWLWMWIDGDGEGEVQYLTQSEFEDDMFLYSKTLVLVHTEFLHVEQNEIGATSVYIHRSLIEEKK